MDFAFVVRQKLEEQGLDQRELANQAEVTESYISQLLGRKKLPPLPKVFGTMLKPWKPTSASKLTAPIPAGEITVTAETTVEGLAALLGQKPYLL